MKIPAIFHWPSPWIWGALGVLIISGNHGAWGIIRGAAVLTLIASGVFLLRGRVCRRTAAGHGADPGHGFDRGSGPATGLDQRLATIESRLTDTQDVMIALSEKVDQWEAERSQLSRTQGTRP